MAPAGLEARYRRLLRWYPAEHRAVHCDEMLGVLMSGAPQDRDRPGIAESANVLLGALRIRVRPGRALSGRDGWRDTLAVFSVGAPVLAFASALLAWPLADLCLMLSGQQGGLGMGLAYFQGGLYPYSAIFYNVADAHPSLGPVIWLAVYGQGLVALLALLGLRRWAALASVSYLLYALRLQRHRGIRPAPAPVPADHADLGDRRPAGVGRTEAGQVHAAAQPLGRPGSCGARVRGAESPVPAGQHHGFGPARVDVSDS
jgi:hypothetical protein